MTEYTPEMNAIQKGKVDYRKFIREHAQHQVNKNMPDGPFHLFFLKALDVIEGKGHGNVSSLRA